MKQKAGIVTLYGYLNYGNRLQNYAVQEIMKQYGFDVTTIVVYNSIKPMLKTLLYFVTQFLGNTNVKRYLLIHKFSRRYITTQTIFQKDKKIPGKISQKYSYFVVGSDQVWNPYLRKKERENFFLKFADKSQRICLSPSIGVKELEEQFKTQYKEGMNGFTHLSCREESGVRIIEELTGRKCELLIDPSLALCANQWRELFSDIKLDLSEKYIVIAMLGTLSRDKEEYIQKICKLHDTKVKDIFKEAYSPEQVLFLISHASIVCTDSFHFTAFSINFNTPFIVFKREGNHVNSDIFSRLETLLRMFSLSNRIYPILPPENAISCNFEYSNSVLDKERKKFYNYVERTLK